jgi:hypothetical protein
VPAEVPYVPWLPVPGSTPARNSAARQ